MQLSSLKSFVVIDFSELSESEVTKIEQPEIDNLKALKIFVEDAQSVYRWEYGESLFPHNHSGIIVKASSIITPHYKLAEPKEPAQMKKTANKYEEHEAV